MAYYRKPAVGMDDIHHLLGVTLRDARQDRYGRIVGLDYNHEQPIIDVSWSGEKKVERISVSLEQLAGLMKAFIDARRVSNVRSLGSERTETKGTTVVAAENSASETVESQRRRA